MRRNKKPTVITHSDLMLNRIKTIILDYYANSSNKINPAYVRNCKSIDAICSMLIKTSGDDTEHIMWLYHHILIQLVNQPRYNRTSP